VITLKLTKEQVRTIRVAFYSAVQNEEAFFDAHRPQFGRDCKDFKQQRSKTRKLIDRMMKLDKVVVEAMLRKGKT
jgi:hypothetical protein